MSYDPLDCLTTESEIIEKGRSILNTCGTHGSNGYRFIFDKMNEICFNTSKKILG